MYFLAKIIQCVFPLIALILLVFGIRKKSINYVISSLWLSLIALLIHFQISGTYIFGSYFDYTNAAIYSFNLIILLISLIQILIHLSNGKPFFRYAYSLLSAFMVIGTCLIITNLWINASFISNIKPGTPMMQVAQFDKPAYCTYQYVFYKITTDGTAMYLCPNHYGLIASIGPLPKIPDFITTQLHLNTTKIKDDTP